MQATISVAELETLTNNVTMRRAERTAWQEAYTRIGDTITAAHRGNTTRCALHELERAFEGASKKLALARLAEERAVGQYLRITNVGPVDVCECHRCGEKMEPDVVAAQGDTCVECMVRSLSSEHIEAVSYPSDTELDVLLSEH